MVFRVLITHKLTNDYEQKIIRIFFTIFVFDRIWSKTFTYMPNTVICTIFRKIAFSYIIYRKYSIYY